MNTTTTTQTPAHTPTPWTYSPAVNCIFGPPKTAPQICAIPAFSGEEGTANAHLIVEAVNSHAALVAENKRLRDLIDHAKAWNESDSEALDETGKCELDAPSIKARRAALAQTEGGK